MTAPGKPKRPAKTKPLGVNPAFVGSRPTLADAAVGVPLDADQTDVLRLLHQIDANTARQPSGPVVPVEDTLTFALALFAAQLLSEVGRGAKTAEGAAGELFSRTWDLLRDPKPQNRQEDAARKLKVELDAAEAAGRVRNPPPSLRAAKKKAAEATNDLLRYERNLGAKHSQRNKKVLEIVAK